MHQPNSVHSYSIAMMDKNLNSMESTGSSNAIGIQNAMSFPLSLPAIDMSAPPPPMELPRFALPPHLELFNPNSHAPYRRNPLPNPTLPFHPFPNLSTVPPHMLPLPSIPYLYPMPRPQPMTMPPIAPIPLAKPNKKPTTKPTKKRAKAKKKQQPKAIKKKLSRPRNMDVMAHTEDPPPLINHNTQNTNAQLPLGHPQRIQFKDTMSGAFTGKKQQRSVQHRTWARPKKCRECGTTYPCTDDYDMHRMVYHSDGIQMEQKCLICLATYGERRYLNRHYRNSHFKFVCKIDGNGNNQEGLKSEELKRKKGNESICGYRFLDKEDLDAHQAIVHRFKNEYNGSRDQGPVIQFMNGSDAKHVVIERLTQVSNANTDDHSNDIDEESEDNDDLMMDLSDITMTLGGGAMECAKKHETRKKSKKKEKKSTKKKKNKKRKRGKSPKKSKKKRKGKSREQSPPAKKTKVE